MVQKCVVSTPVAHKKAKTGRPPKLTPEIAKIITDSVAAGVPRRYAAARAGVTDRTVRRWLVAARKAKSGPLLFLLSALKKADADSVAGGIASIQFAGTPHEEVTVKETAFTDSNGVRTTKTETTKRKVSDWTARAWMLERNHPDYFSLDREKLRQLLKEVAAQKVRVEELKELYAADDRNKTGGQAAGPLPRIIPLVGGDADPNAI